MVSVLPQNASKLIHILKKKYIPAGCDFNGNTLFLCGYRLRFIFYISPLWSIITKQ